MYQLFLALNFSIHFIKLMYGQLKKKPKPTELIMKEILEVIKMKWKKR